MAKKARKTAVVLCNGGALYVEGISREQLANDCVALSEQYPDGIKACVAGCFGGGSCAEVCKFDAISIGLSGAAIVDQALCRGCGLCVKKCPQHLIVLRDRALPISVRCSNADAAATARKACANSCIACGACVRKCPVGALSIENGHAVINEMLCISCGMCAVTCPRGVIRDAAGMFSM